MLEKIIDFSIRNKLIIILFTITMASFGIYAIIKIPVGAVPDITNNQVQVITTSGNLSTQEIEQFITAPVEMEMANLPGVQEIRSISKFGISVVTIVFDEKLGTYLPRQLISEKIKSASANIPEEYGTPEMGPITTGLGEIYQYIVDVKPEFRDKYSAMELRTIQDWIIKRRLSGINGVVEINSWGGYLKQYEIAINPTILKSFDLNLMDIFSAIEKNNSISGGAYIEKTNQSYFIRGDGQAKSLEDIGNIVVKNTDGTIILIKDVATVNYGFANRFGAITANGNGETVLGQIMMLKNANSKVVIDEVKRRVAQIQENLPEGVFINPILERSELISKTSFTVIENLILGAIIVLFIVILLLGNFRSALVIASMIPLALLFTIGMMYIFGIDANLMSLGALDFGIIIDGAVIIVEFIAIKMAIHRTEFLDNKTGDIQPLMDKVSFEGASKMMSSAIFGQVIILIVFIPILSLTGVEGKMFRPMALSFSFAIMGAMILGLTWLPVASSLFLRPSAKEGKNLSQRLMDFIYKLYLPSIKWACNHKKVVLSMALASLVITGLLFSRMGGEFVPTLDEGDFVIQPVLKTGTSLSKTVEMTTKMENILIKEFPNEISQIVSRIGAAEVPTDPMSMEEIDMIIKLKPRDNWKLAKDKEDLAEKFKEALSIIPGVEYEFTQPIEMRFNELITGVRSDIAIKIYGEDLDYINKKALEVKNAIANVPGASDIILEKTSGLPQIKVEYNRNKIAYYGTDIQTLNSYLSAAFGGKSAGMIFEGEKRFDVVMRLNTESRTDINDIRNLQVPVSNGYQVPFSELADIQYTYGPAKISRDNTHRRVVVSVNVRNRDLQSVIEDIQKKIDGKITLKPGYYIEYGGQFENLKNATNRLMFAVPVALLLIFIFLHFAFKSLRDALLIFTSIPLATVGGVFLLWARGMPFSVSAGIGFIALFGIAVLNGIVLIEHLKELQHQGVKNMRELILMGTKNRLRPVLLTAGAAAMGFLPMAISTGAGAEVQRPLATVVIGGLITSTLLTLIALPLLFEIMNSRKIVPRFFRVFSRSKTLIILGFLILPVSFAHSQSKEIDLAGAINIALSNNNNIAALKNRVEEQKMLQSSTFSPDKTLISYGFDQNNIAENNHPLMVFGIEQSFSFPSLYRAQLKSAQISVSLAETELMMEENELKKSVSAAYYTYHSLLEKERIYRELDSLLTQLAGFVEKKVENGEMSRLEMLSVQAKKNQTGLLLKSIRVDAQNSLQRLAMYMNYEEPFSLPAVVEELPEITAIPDSLPVFSLLDIKSRQGLAQIKIEKSLALPDLSLNYFLGTNKYSGASYYHGFQIGLSLPLFYGAHRAKIKAAAISNEYQNQQISHQRDLIMNTLSEKWAGHLKYKALISDYLVAGKPLYDEIMKIALKSYQLGEINFYNFVNSYESAIEIQSEFIDNKLLFRTTALEIIYFSN